MLCCWKFFLLFVTAPVLSFDAEAIAVFDQLRSQQVPVSTMDLRIATGGIQAALDIKGGYSPGISKR
ncbi:hypothetical protein [Nostoc sp. CHAB 5715]|uniref:hypothetical protein n=1 Tax=Nostoc sp. CHAB 5715 TaxID=2780400 RepID=UPI001E3614B5|nr:hypothetical protein [Nostoc sp. CHAB 5715]MCC5622985.1 hypothetical protein [Nostoc sp. CHAB 5715]